MQLHGQGTPAAYAPIALFFLIDVDNADLPSLYCINTSNHMMIFIGQFPAEIVILELEEYATSVTSHDNSAFLANHRREDEALLESTDSGA